MKKSGENIICFFCKTKKYMPKWRIIKTRKLFCNRKCYANFQRTIITIGKPAVIKRCIICNKEFRIWVSKCINNKGKTCSKKCARISISKTLTGRTNPRHSVFMKGKRYHYYIDRTRLKKYDTRNDPSYQNWRKQVLSRDNNSCKISNKNCKGHLEAHHILSWRNHKELRYDINNGITLCQFHHPRKWEKEKRLIPVFKRLVSASKV